MTDQPEVSFYGHWICPFATRVEFALHQRGITHDVIDLPPSAVRGPDFVLPPEFLEHSPRREIPMVRIGAEYRADSIPILEWLEEKISDHPLLPADPDRRALVRERMAWVDRHAFRAMVGVYYGTDPAKIQRATEALADALDQMGRWTLEEGWLAGPEPTLAEAVAIPIHVRLDGLRRLGFTAPLTDAAVAAGDACRTLGGWAAVEWDDAQVEEFVGRFTAHRRTTPA